MLQELFINNLTPQERSFAISLKGLDQRSKDTLTHVETTGPRAMPFFELKIISGCDDSSFSRLLDHLNSRGLTTSADISVNEERKMKSVFVAPSIRENLTIMIKNGYLEKGGSKPAVEDAGEILTSDYAYVTNRLKRSKNPDRQEEAKNIIGFFSSLGIKSIDDITILVARSRVAEKIITIDSHPLYKDPNYFNLVKKTYLKQGIISYQYLLSLLAQIDPVNTEEIRMQMEEILKTLIKESNFIEQEENLKG